jgi:tetratricopeptide (TPR) repeat protein
MDRGNRTKLVSAVVLLLAFLPLSARAGGPGGPAKDHAAGPPTSWSDLSPEVQELVAGTVLQRDLPAPTESPEVIRRYLRLGRAQGLDADTYLELMRRTAVRWPQSRLAHAGLADALRDAHAGSPSPEELREAATHLLRAAELSLGEGRIRYQDAVAELLPRVGAAGEAEAFFENALAVADDEGDLYVTHLAYAGLLAKEGRDESADAQYEAAVERRPDGIYGAYELYSVHLMATGRYQRVLDLLTPDVVANAEILHDFFLGMRCKAARSLGAEPETVPDCRALPPAPVAPTLGAQPGLVSRLTTRAHSNNSDDCRYQAGCAYHPSDPSQYRCYNYLVWNLAEIMKNETGGESPGSRASVAWTVRDRATRVSTTGCGTFLGANTNCTSVCPWPGNAAACTLQKKLCCVEHYSGQFVDTHTTSVTFEEVERARRVVDGALPDPVSGYIPQGASGCVLNNCDGTAYCNATGGSLDFAPDGPIFFYGNYVTGNRCYGYQPGINTACAVVANETCGNSTDGSGSDNCYLRATRQRIWTTSAQSCGTNCTTNGSERTLTASGYLFKTPTETPRFKTPGGKVFVINAAVASGSTTMRVTLRNSAGTIIYTYAPVTVSLTAYTDIEVRSDAVVSSTVDTVRVTNEGTGSLKVRTITARD